MLGLGGQNRWKLQTRVGQVVSGRVVNRQAGGYTVEFGQDRMRGFMKSEQLIALGTEVLLQFVGYQNHVPVFHSGFNPGQQK